MDESRPTHSRRFVLGSLAAGLSGCSGVLDTSTPTPTERPDTDGDGVPDVEDDYPDRELWAKQVGLTDESITLTSGGYKGYPLDTSEGQLINIEILVSQGDAPIDFLFMPREQFTSKYPDGNFSYVDKGYHFGTQSVNQRGIIPSTGNLVAVVDYTTAFNEPTTPEITVDVLIEQAKMPE